jgi:hypothetical protein
MIKSVVLPCVVVICCAGTEEKYAQKRALCMTPDLSSEFVTATYAHYSFAAAADPDPAPFINNLLLSSPEK